MFGLNPHQSAVTAEPIKKWPCLPPLYLHVFYSLISKDNRRNWWTAGDGRCPSHILYLELVEIATMILCVFHRIDVIWKFYLGWEPLDGRALFILASCARGELLNHSVESSLSRGAVLCPVGCTAAASSPSTHKLPGARLPQVVPMKNVFRPHQYLLLREITPGSHVWMEGLDNKEGWMLKNWCFWTVVLEKTLESPLDSKEIKLVNPKGNQPCIFIVRIDAETEAPILWPPNAKNRLIGKILMLGKMEGRRRRGRQRMRWLGGMTDSGHELEQTLGDGEGQGSPACCSPWCCKELDRT